MLKITNILNPLTGGSTTTEYKWEKGKPLSEYMGYDGECVVAHNNSIINLPINQIMPARKDEYMVMPIPAGGDKESLRVLSYMAMTVVAFIPVYGPYIAAAGAGIATFFLQEKDKDQSTSPSYAWQHRSSPTAAMGSAMPVIYGKARIRPILKNRYIEVSGDKQYLYALYSLAAHKVDETTYPRWEPRGYPYPAGTIVRTPLSADEPGKTYYCPSRTKGTIVYTNTRYWKVWHGTASFAEDIFINGVAINSFIDNLTWETRPGLAQQDVIIGFDVTYTNFVQDKVLYLDYPEISKDVAKFRIVSIPGGTELRWDIHPLLLRGETYTIRAGSNPFIEAHIGHTFYVYFNPDSSTTDYSMQMDTEPTSGYVIFSFKLTVTDMTDKHYPNITILPAGLDWISPIVPQTNAHNIEFVFEFPYGLYNTPVGKGMVSARCRLFAQYREYTVGGTKKWLNFNYGFSKPDHSELDADSGIASVHITRKKPEAFYISLKAKPDKDTLEYGKSYEIRVSASSTSIVKLINIAKIVYGEENADGDRPGFTYPGEPLLGIEALASGQIDSALDVQVDVERSKVWVWNTNVVGANKWVEGAADNHAWAVYDILVNGYYNSDTILCHPTYPYAGNEAGEAVYGCGVNPAYIDYDSFKEWATNVEALDYELNIVWDTFMTAWDAILRICQEGRGIVYPVGTKIFAMAYKESDPVQLFTMGNIHMDTFAQKYMESKQTANMLEVKYWDKERNYEETILAVRTANWDSDLNLNKPSSMTLYGTVGYTQASKTARFIMLTNELLNNIITFGVDVDTLASQVGDVVEIGHDVLNTGSSGRVVSYTELTGSTSNVVLDRTVTSVSGDILEIRHADGTIESKATDTTGSSATLHFTTAWATEPALHDVYVFGTAQKFRIIEISRTNELMRTLTLMQYDEDVYVGMAEDEGDGEFTAPKIVPPSTSVGDVADLLNLASNVQLQEVISRNNVTGDYESSIVVTFNSMPPPIARGTWEIHLRDVDVSDINWKGTWVDNTYNIHEKVELNGITYISLEDNNTSKPINIDT